MQKLIYIYVQMGAQGNVRLGESNPFTLNYLRKAVYESTKRKVKKFHPVEIIPIQSDQINSYCFDLGLNKFKGDKLTYGDMTGMFKMTFSDGTFILFAKWLAGQGRNQQLENLFAGEKETWIKFLSFIKGTVRLSKKPKNGIFKVDLVNLPFGGQELIYRPLKKLNDTPVVHHIIKNIEDDMNFFFRILNCFQDTKSHTQERLC